MEDWEERMPWDWVAMGGISSRQRVMFMFEDFWLWLFCAVGAGVGAGVSTIMLP